MALNACKECGKEVSQQAKKCPHCGVPHPTIKISGKGCLILFLILFVPSLAIGIYTAYNTGPAPTTPAEKRTAQIKKQFSSWDGSHIALASFVKKSMHDPDSFKHVSSEYFDLGNDRIIVSMKFRGTNAFGALVTNNIQAECDLDGNVIKITPKEP